MFSRVSILGPGLLGGSLALALAQSGTAVTLWARSTPRLESVQRSLAARFKEDSAIRQRLSLTSSYDEVVTEAQLIILAVPVGSMRSLSEELIAAGLKKEQLVTDVGSVKVSVHQALDPLFSKHGCAFLGSHPMAGSEQTGFEAAEPDLFQSAACILTTEGTGSGPQRTDLREFWERLGCCVHELSASEHDRAVARVSHLPHLLSSACAQIAMQTGEGHLGGGGLRDVTRLASGDPGLWRGILAENASPVAEVLGELITELEQYRRELETRQFDLVENRLLAAKKQRGSSS